MLSQEDNELLCRVGPGTPMGDLMRQYWIPAARSDELPAPNGPPLRVRLLGESLIAFRVTSGKVGLIANSCPHRGASLFYGRNEAEGLRCVYHGWKFDVAGSCIDMPSEPPESNFKHKVRAIAYPCVERGGIIWTYMGARETPPPLPDLEANMAPECRVTTMIRDCNYMQALEGDIDTVHFAFLHMGHLALEDTYEGNFLHYQVKDRAPRYAVTDTEFGTCYGAYRPAEEDTYYWRFANFLFPCWTQAPNGAFDSHMHARAWVPLDDGHCMFVFIWWARAAAANNQPQPVFRDGRPIGGTGRSKLALLPNTTDWLGRWRMAANASNDWLLDRGAQQRNEIYSGIDGIHLQDQAICESMGPVTDHAWEHLAPSDQMITRTRRRLLLAARALRDHGALPPGIDEPHVYRDARSGYFTSPDESRPWQETYASTLASSVHPSRLAAE